MGEKFEPKFEPKKEKGEESPEKAIGEHLDSIKEPLLSKIPEGKAKEFLLDFFKKAEAQLKQGKGGAELDAILNLPGTKEWKARRNLETFSEIKDFFENPPEEKGLETKTGPKKIEVEPEIYRNLKFIQAILQQKYSAASSERKMLVEKPERK